MALLAAGALALSAAAAMAAGTQTPETPKAPEVSKTPEASKPAEASKTTPKAREGKEVAADRVLRGEVTAVEVSATPPTLTIKVMRGKAEETIGVTVPATARISQGKAAKTLTDIKVGDRVWLKYDQMKDRKEADQIRILKSASQTAKPKTS
jgi:hypothetical protein